MYDTRTYQSKKNSRATHVCKTCKSKMNPIINKQGIFLIEIIIWILALFIVPQTAGLSIFVAVAYSAFRLLSKKIVCSQCGSEDIVLKNTPKENTSKG